ncbi:hypothetical protein C8F01DRAFT_701412 [Mycena amicta]|nr:hypothetical protein C8F01DRAFT_701412 [Mycena amicta]
MGKNTKKTQTTLRSQRTRSSKGRLLTDPVHSTALLTDQLRSLGLYAANTVGDGNCLFRALSDQLYGTASRHAQLRKDICDWIARHKARYEPFVEDDRGIETHLRCMRQNATYGGHLELSAFAHLTRRNVKVIQPGLVYVIEWSGGAGPSSPTSPSSAASSPTRAGGKTDFELGSDLPMTEGTIYIAYHDWEHFSSVRNLRGPHTGLPVVQETPPHPYPPSPSTSSHELSTKQQSKADALERKRMEKEAKLEKRAHADENAPPTTAVLLPKVRLKLSSASPAKITTPLPVSAAASHSTSSLSALPPMSADPMRLRTRSGSLLAGRIQHSPKRSLEEVDSSDPEDGESGEGSSGQRRGRRGREGAKRTRSAYVYATAADEGEADADADAGGDGDVEMASDNSASDNDNDNDSDFEDEDDDVDAEGEPDPDVPYPSTTSTSTTPLSLSLSPPALSSSSSLSSLSSISPSPPPESVPVVVKPKPMTRRQRKALGLPKSKLTVTTRSAAAGKIVIPGGRHGPGAGTDDGGEWQRNGAGRLDVRGFRELRI